MPRNPTGPADATWTALRRWHEEYVELWRMLRSKVAVRDPDWPRYDGCLAQHEGALKYMAELDAKHGKRQAPRSPRKAK